MKTESGITFVDIILGIGFLALFIIFYLGFYYPDPFFVSRNPTNQLISIGLKTILPVFFILICWLYYKIKTKKLHLKNLLLTIATTVLVILIIYPLWNIYTGLTRNNKVNSEFHPYLQVKPQDIDIATEDLAVKKVKVFCLGGSTTEFKRSDGLGWPDIVEKNINAGLIRNDLKFYNQGKQWYTTLHMLVNYQTNLRYLKPDVIIIMETINDLLHNADFAYFSQHDFRVDYGHFAGPDTRLIDNRSLPEMLADKWNRIWYFKGRIPVYQESFKGEVPFARNLNTIIDLARLDGTKVILMSQPSLYKDNSDPVILPHLYMLNYEAIGKDKYWTYQTALNGFKRYKDIIANVAQTRNVYYIDLDNAVPKTLEYFYDDVHYKDKTFALIAQIITEKLIAMKIFE